MKVKQRSDDFRVRELLREDVLAPRGEFRVYRVLKSKHTSFEAARVLAQEAGASAGDVSMCGLKDRQGVTLQHMALRHGPPVSIRSPDLRIETAGFTSEPLDSKASEGNAFEIVLRGLAQDDVDALRANAHSIRAGGLINYFDDQRFGNLRHGQGWIALELMRGEHEAALRALLTSRSPHDDRKAMAFKRALSSYWGDWTACRDIAGKFGEHHSLFEHLKREPQDFAGAFFHLASRLRLIHLYAYQSHLWNRAVAEWVRARVEPAQRVVLKSAEGPLVYPEIGVDLKAPPEQAFRLPGPKLKDVEDREQFELLADALAHDGLVPAQFSIEGVSGFALKGEDRPLFVTPAHLRLRPARADVLNRGQFQVEVRFELPRGAYATLVVRRLLETSARRSNVAAPRVLSSKPAPPPREDGDRFGEAPSDRVRAPRSGAPRSGPKRDWGPPKRVRLQDREGEGPPRKPARRAPPRDGGGPPPRGERRGPPRDERRGPPREDAPRGEQRFERGPREQRGGFAPRRDGPPARGRFERSGPPAERRAPRRDVERPRRDEGGPPRERPKNLPLANWKPKRGPGADRE